MNIRLKFKEYLCKFDSAIQLYKFTTLYSGEPKKKIFFVHFIKCVYRGIILNSSKI